MNFYQKTYGLVTLLVIGITCLIAFALIDPPYSSIFITETVAVICAEFIFGLVSIVYMKKSDSLMVLTAGYNVVAFLYLLFTLGMIFLTFSNISEIKFIAGHIIGFIIAIILILHYYMAEHNAIEQSQSEGNLRSRKNDLRNKIADIALRSIATFPEIPGLNKEMDTLMETIRFSRDPDDSCLSELEQINRSMDELLSAIREKNQNMFQSKLDELKKNIRLYEKKV